MKVLFIHGLEGSPQGAKAQCLRRHFDVIAEGMDTGDFSACVAQQARAVAEHAPHVVVGSSFGGAVAAALLSQGAWRGPTVLLAPALGHFGVPLTLPEGVPVLIIHGTRDAIVPLDESRSLSRSGTPGAVRLCEVDDEHRLVSLLEGDALASMIADWVATAAATR